MRKRSNREMAEMITQFRTPPTHGWADLARDIETALDAKDREIIGERRGPSVAEAEHYYQCAECGGWVDARDLAAVLDHERGGSHPVSAQPSQ